MVLSRWFLFLVLQQLHELNGSKVKLNNGGFEDIVVAINPQLPEDPKIVNSIKDMIKDGSAYLFSATDQRFYFKSVKIIIPLTWTTKTNYKRLTTESYEKADVIVAPSQKDGVEPYTLQYGGCGQKGRYIHFTDGFLTNDTLIDVYGPRGRVFVHEWAHLRWGIFDEYNYDEPFYSTGQSTPEATRCSAGITGKYIFQTSTGKTRPCKIEPQTGLYEAECQFVPERKQNSAASIMYVQGLPSVTQFCNKSNHNIWATNMQNKQCHFRSTWEVIMDSADFAGSSPIAARPPAPTFFLLQAHDRVVCLVLDVSESMRLHNRINRLRQATEIFLLQIIEKDSWVGIVTFASTAKIAVGLQQIVSDSVRKSLTMYLPITAGGGTKICPGLREGFQVFLSKFQSTEGCEIVLVTDDEDSSIGSCFTEVERSGSVIHTIALGPKAARQLEALADMTGGLKFSASDSLESNGLIDAFSAISSGRGSAFQQSIQLESESQSIGISQVLNGVVSIDKSVGNDTFFVVTWSLSTSPPAIILTHPRGIQYSQTDFAIDNTDMRLARLQIKGTAEAGDWTYSIQNDHNTAQVISMMVTTRAVSLTEPPVTVKPYLSKDSSTYSNPLIIYAEVSQGFLPVFGAKVIATVEPEVGNPVVLDLLDNGAGADILEYDGIYSRYFTSFQGNGRYTLKVHVQGKEKIARRVHRQSRAMYVPGYVNPDGTVSMNPPPPTPNTTIFSGGNFNLVGSGGSFIVSNVPANISGDTSPPCQITDLQAVLIDKDNEFFLSWTAPGDDYDSGTAKRYEIKKSENHVDLRKENFQRATSVNTLGLTPEPAGTKQSFQFKAGNVRKGNPIYFAIRAIDESNNFGEVSMPVRATLFTSALPSTLQPTKTAASMTTSATAVVSNMTAYATTHTERIATKRANDSIILAIIICISVISFCTIAGIIIYYFIQKRNNLRSSEVLPGSASLLHQQVYVSRL